MYIYNFEDGNKDMRDILGGKGAGLAEMTRLHLPVPKGFTISSDACLKYLDDDKFFVELKPEIDEKINELELKTHKTFGYGENPLLVSVRSGARISMPGMMDTILNLGLNSETVNSMIKKTGNSHFVLDSYRRLIEMYSDVVLGLPKGSFGEILNNMKKEKGYTKDSELTDDDLRLLISKYKENYKNLTGYEFSENSKELLYNAVKAVFKSWNTERAKVYRKLNEISDSYGTAVNVQEMVFGNLNDNSATGVCFSRNPVNGKNELFGEYLTNAQGEDIVSGVRTPSPIAKLKEDMPNVYDEFLSYAKELERHYKDMQDMEFTIEDGHLYILQTRNGKRTAKADVKCAVDMVREGIITKEEAILRVDSNRLDEVLHKEFNEDDLKGHEPIAKGLAASPGAAYGKVYFSAEDIKKAHDDGEENLILVRTDTSPEDIVGMKLANGMLTVRGGMTSHAAVVARGMGACCISGCSDIEIDYDKKLFRVGKNIVHEKDYISLDGSTGNVYVGMIKTEDAKASVELQTFMSWCDDIRKIGVRANCDTKIDAENAVKFGAEGVGLCRTEHMFFTDERIFDLRRMILSPNEEIRKESLKKLEEYQRKDFLDIFSVMKERPVIIRLLDPPLHEFLPKKEEDIKKLAKSLDMSIEDIKKEIDEKKEFNPMMGHRGCRLDVTYPEIGRMQADAIAKAAIDAKKMGINVVSKIMIPLTISKKEYLFVKDIIVNELDKVMKDEGVKFDYKIGTMIETPRAAILANTIAPYADFMSFGTNDLTQLTLGFSRDDSPKFINSYIDNGLIKKDPFKSIDTEGVGKLVDLACRLARLANPSIELGVCGEHGGDRDSIEFFSRIGLNYVSCSPYRLLNARCSLAKAAIKEKMD